MTRPDEQNVAPQATGLDTPSQADNSSRSIHGEQVPEPASAAPLTVEQVEQFRRELVNRSHHLTITEANALCDLALRSLAPGFVSVPRELYDELMEWFGKGMIKHDQGLPERFAMLAATETK